MGCRRITRSAWASTVSTIPRASRSGCARWNACSRRGRSGWTGSLSSRSPRRRGPASGSNRRTRGGGAARGARTTARFAQPRPPPVVLKAEHHQPEDIYEYYRAAELCMVTSLHDGMNLVAKEFVSSRDDERGALILSQFTGAARELPEAIIVNPYDTDQCAAALHMALSMPAAEQRARMRLMRGLLQDFNVYRWAGRMLMDAAAMRRRGRLLERAARPERPSRRSPDYRLDSPAEPGLGLFLRHRRDARGHRRVAGRRPARRRPTCADRPAASNGRRSRGPDQRPLDRGHRPPHSRDPAPGGGAARGRAPRRRRRDFATRSSVPGARLGTGAARRGRRGASRAAARG